MNNNNTQQSMNDWTIRRINTFEHIYKTSSWDEFFNTCFIELKEKSLEFLMQRYEKN